jgi:hypothetical protein
MIFRSNLVFIIHLPNNHDPTSLDPALCCEADAEVWTYDCDRFAALLHFGELIAIPDFLFD